MRRNGGFKHFHWQLTTAEKLVSFQYQQTTSWLAGDRLRKRTQKPPTEFRLIEAIRQAVHNSEMSLNDLGRKAGIDQSCLSRFMRGERGLTLAAAEKIGNVLGLRLAMGSELKPASPEKSETRHETGTTDTLPGPDTPKKRRS